ncbi:GerAB/ArcD/ProY family transporter [Paenibacillus planticolens]|uniref:GerAB/ArcD/ProY family transporter n=1 Tax=Paenibacillus planticolens TaxID=2654976 RepID=A0ABX1ZUD5_9BACL|nr:GerAB/ArcD/ProY family transporter [Paenibacillus planticolens]NOV02250.1 GerAB/ArcD/ProY family transporter [Paenibacillus planticolens]
MTVVSVKEKLNAFHIALLIFMIEIDITIFDLPRIVAENLGTNGWVGLLVLSCAATFNIFLYWIVYKSGNGRSAFQILESSLPKILLYPFYVLIALVWIGLASFIGKNFIFIFQLLYFQSMNPMIIFFVFCIMVYFLLSKNLYNISKANTLFFFLTIWIVGLIFFYFDDWKMIRFTNSFFQGTTKPPSFHNWVEVYKVFVGYELCLFFIPFTNKESKLFKGVFAGHWLATFIQLIIIWISSGFYSFEQLQALLYPLMNMFSYIELPFINRIESVIFPFFLYVNLISTVMFCIAALMTVKQLFPHARPKSIEMVISIIVFLTGFIPQILRKSQELLSLAFHIEIGIAFSMPVLLILVLKFQKWKGRNAKNEI